LQTSGPFKKLLVATDFSPHAEAALRSAIWLAQRSATEITFAHVVADAATIATFSYEAVIAQDSEIVERELRRVSDERLTALEQALRATGIRLKRITLAGLPFVALIYAVQSERFDLVVCGSRGQSGFRELVVGSTAKRLIRKCPADVWITHSGVPSAPTVVLAAIDFSELSRTVVLRARWIAQEAAAPLHIVHVLEPRTLDAPLLDAILRNSGRNWRDQVRDAARRRLQTFVEEVVGSSLTPSLHVDFGEPWEFIRDTARQVKADLAVMGTVGRSGIQGVWLGNTAEKLLQVMDFAVPTVKPPGFVSPIPPPPRPD
jgi:nucleotide-binding universal stress UspA family protein